MWSAFMNGSGLHAGGGAGYVPSQGWEFVPCSRMERPGKGKIRNPLKRISSPPTVFSQLYEQPFQALGAERGPGAPSEFLRGQMWSGPEPQQQQQQQQQQHARLKKKFEELKKRHVEEKEEWMREKESLLREVANIQGGENRRILLDLKTVLDEVQVEVKREEEKRNELQLQYTRDRCSWELEKAELKRRIAQLESREGSRLMTAGVQSAAGLGVGGVPRSPKKYPDDSLCREREEQRRILADTHTTAMDLRCRLEHNERDWLREKADLLERFDVERREWECQLKDMQRKIEELYCEVRAKREGTGVDIREHYDDSAAHRLSIPSTSTGSSFLSSSSQSEQRSTLFTGFGNNKLCRDSDGHHSAGYHTDTHDQVQTLYEEGLRLSGTWQQDTAPQSRVIATEELDSILFLRGCAESHKLTAKGNESVFQNLRENPPRTELNYGSEKKRNTTALNAALKEIARVSEELCSYQEEIRQKGGEKRSPPEQRDMSLLYSNSRPDAVEPCDLSEIYDELRALEREHWNTLSPENTLRSHPVASWETCPSPDSHREPFVSPETLSEIDPTAPPVPPRSSSWNLSSQQDTDLNMPESPMTAARKCHSSCVVVDRKCTSPSIVRKFEAMLQENEGKILIDGAISSCTVPANQNCNVSCCHNRWSCDASKLTNKVSSYVTVQKSFSEVNIVTAAKNMGTDHSLTGGNLKSQEVHPKPQTPIETPVHVSAPDIPPASPVLQGSRRNITLEQKTAEFNRCLFQAEMGRGVEEQDTFSPPDLTSLLCQQLLLPSTASGEELLPRETHLKQHYSKVPTHCFVVEPNITQSLSSSDISKQSPEAAAQSKCGSRGQTISKMQETHDLLSKEIYAAQQEYTTKPAQRPEVKLSPSRKIQIKATTDGHCGERFMSENMRLSVGTSSSDSDPEEEPRSRTAVSKQPSAENKQKPTGGQQLQPKHVPALSDCCRPGLRMMNEHPWKPLTLAAYPRPEGSRSNYGAVERILKNYETAAKNMNQQKETVSNSNLTEREKSEPELDMLDMDSVPTSLFIRETLPHSPSTHKILDLKEIQLTVQDQDDYSWDT
ncbi:uncharacterized protein [Eucyclogobius newberryi]|uniref:uncharacterized protein isoform X2 n=1 Tax=Eucyclogobius newberryi TaxID=166745 RepID=UPI003B5A712C